MKKELICITCPMGCHLCAELNDNNEVLNVSGNSCPRGDLYARKELTHPERVITTTVKIDGAIHKLLPVMSNGTISKDLIFEVMKIINNTSVKSPIHRGDVIIKNICETGIDIIASRSM